MCLQCIRGPAQKRRKVIRNGNKKEINANIKTHTDSQTNGEYYNNKKKRENIPKKFFIHFCTMPSTDKSKAKPTQKKNFPLQKFLK